jgi:hypothetical protein
MQAAFDMVCRFSQRRMICDLMDLISGYRLRDIKSNQLADKLLDVDSKPVSVLLWVPFWKEESRKLIPPELLTQLPSLSHTGKLDGLIVQAEAQPQPQHASASVTTHAQDKKRVAHGRTAKVHAAKRSKASDQVTEATPPSLSRPEQERAAHVDVQDKGAPIRKPRLKIARRQPPAPASQSQAGRDGDAKVKSPEEELAQIQDHALEVAIPAIGR